MDSETDEELRKIALSHLARAEQGDNIAQRLLAKMCRLGLGVKQDYAEAEKWYLKSADQGNAGAQIELAEMYQKDKSPLQSKASAYFWYSIATFGGNKLSKDKLDVVASFLTDEQKSAADTLVADWRRDHPRMPAKQEAK